MTLSVAVDLKKPPTVEVVPLDGVDYSAGDEAVVIAELAGLTLDDWQEHVLRNALVLREDGRFAAFEVGLVVGRQNGKSEILIAVIVWALFTERFDLPQTIFAAHEYKTAKKIFKRLSYLLDPPRLADPLSHAAPELLCQVKKVIHSHGEEGVELHNGRQVSFVARTKGSGRGFTGDLVLLDEAYALTADQVSALMYTMGARPNTQVWYSSSGPFEDSEKQIEVMARARSENPERFAYFGWEAPEGTAADDWDWWVRCTPAHPHRTSFETLEDEHAADREGFAREKLCMRVSKVDRVIPADVWMKAQTGDAPGDTVTLAVDVDEGRAWYSVVAVGDGVGELVEHKPTGGLTDGEKPVRLIDRLTQLASDHAAVLCLDTSGPAGSLVDDLEAEGVPLEKFSGRELADACGRLYDGLVDGTLAVRRHPDFDKAVSGAARKPLGDAWGWSRTRSTVDITPLVALTLAHAAEKPVEVSVMVI